MTRGVRLAVWSGPRSISTALMRSWENRPDCRVVDEPLYAYYLAHTGIDHPGREEVLAIGETSWRRVVDELTAPTVGVYYQKHMAHHLVGGLPRQWIGCLTNIVLIRNPAEVVSSYVRSRPEVDVSDIGLEQQVELYEQLGPQTPVVDAGDFLRDPEGYLRFMCDYAGVDFTPAMLHWPPGPRDSDGVWARYWYDSVVSSTGFEKHTPREVELDAAALSVVDRLRPLYERLRAVRTVL
jgi:Sulfotransferase domain